jgi:hypothetical protein
MPCAGGESLDSDRPTSTTAVVASTARPLRPPQVRSPSSDSPPFHTVKIKLSNVVKSQATFRVPNRIDGLVLHGSTPYGAYT